MLPEVDDMFSSESTGGSLLLISPMLTMFSICTQINGLLSFQILLVFTDGIQTWAPAKMTKLTKASEPLKRMGVTIIPVGVWGDQINVGSLLDISVDSNTVYNMEFFPELLQALKKLSKMPCKGIQKLP